MNKGFGLLEVLLAAGLIAILVGGAVILGAVVFRTSQINQHRMQSMYLCQEAIEGVKEIQRSNWVLQDPAVSWDKGISAGNYSISRVNGKWKLTTWSQDNSKTTLNNVDFFRKISIYDVKTDQSIVKNNDFRNSKIIKKLECEVNWQDFSNNQTSKIQTLISDWKPL